MTDMKQLMEQAKQMQESMQKAQQELTNLVVEGKSAGGLVKIKMNGRHQALSTWLDFQLFDEEKELVEDYITAAINDASNQIEKASQEKIVGLTKGMELPAEFQQLMDEDKSGE
jgi:DNA-binding YbaB/EbfC family protein